MTARQRKPNITLRWLVAGAVAVCAILFFGLRQQKPLSEEEKLLVGVWLLTTHPEEEPIGEVTFTSNRKLKTSDGQFSGNWLINQGQLKMTMRNNDSLAFLDLDSWSGSNSQSETLNLTFSGDGDRVELSLPGKTSGTADTVMRRIH